MLKSRSGDTAKLIEVLDDATLRARANIDSRESSLSDDERATLADQIALAAIKYADLSTERQRDYVFDLDRMVAAEGDTGPYIQYAYARIRSIQARAGASEAPTTFTLAEEPARQLALGLLGFPEAVAASLEHSHPHRLANYLFEFSQRFTSFYDACPVLHAEGTVRAERLALCELSARTLQLGLALLGIEAPERM